VTGAIATEYPDALWATPQKLSNNQFAPRTNRRFKKRRKTTPRVMSMQTRAYILAAITTSIIIFFGAAAVAAVPSGPCRPVSDRTSEVGCWVLSEHPIGELTESEVFWHLDAYPTCAAAEAAKSPSERWSSLSERFGCSPLQKKAGKLPAAKTSRKSGLLRSMHMKSIL
jgi:hypothetical protein